MLTINHCLREAVACLLKGDTDGRDKWCALASHIEWQITRFGKDKPLGAEKAIELTRSAVCTPAPKSR